MPMIRLSPSGPPIVGNANGDLLVWNSTTLQWDISSSTPYTITEFDYLLTTRQDLVDVVAPVGGDFLLPGGSYFCRRRIVLQPGERIVIDNTNVFMMGSGIPQGRGITAEYADGQPNIEVINGGTLTAYQIYFGIVSVGRQGLLVGAGSKFTAIDSSFPTTTSGAPGISVEGDAVLYRCTLGNGIQPVSVSGSGTLRMVDCELYCGSPGSACLGISGTNSARVDLDRCLLSMTAEEDDAVVTIESVSSSEVRVFSRDCRYFRAPAQTAIIRLTSSGGGGPSLYCRGDRFASASPGIDGIGVDGNVSNLVIDGCEWYYITTALLRTAGVAAAVRFSGNRLGATCSNGVEWATASLPTGGLIETDNQFGAGITPFVGHTTADAAVMRRANFLAAVPQSETALIP